MKRVYTDDRFPDHEVVNFGETQFFVFRNGKQIEEFESFEAQSPKVTEAYAQRRANDYFERLDSHNEPEVSGELAPLPEGVSEGAPVPQQIVSYLLED